MNPPKQNSSVGTQTTNPATPQPAPEPGIAQFVREARQNAAPIQGPVRGDELQSAAGGSQYDSGLVRGQDQNAHRANQQGTMSEIGARIARFIPDVALGIAEQVGYLGDMENVAGAVGASETDFDNWLSTAARKGKDYLAEELPAYRKDNEVFSPGDSAWWVNNVADLAESVSEFYVTGAGIGKGLASGAEFLATKLAGQGLAKSIQAAKGASEIVKLTEGAAGLNNKLVTGAQFATSSMLAYTGGVMQAQESYRNIYAQGLKDGKSDEESKSAAAQAAASIVRWTTAGTSLLNITSLGPIFRPFKQELAFAETLGIDALESAARKATTTSAVAGAVNSAEAVTSETLLAQLYKLKADPKMAQATESLFMKMFKPGAVGFEMGQEAVEEFTENAAQVYGEGVGKKKLGDNTEVNYFSKEAGLAAALGAVGGGMGGGIMHGIDMYSNNAGKEQSDFQSAIDLRITSLEKFKENKEALVNAVKNKDNLATMVAKNDTFTHNVYHAIQSQTDEYLKAAYQDVLNLPLDQATAAGYDVNEKSPTYYKKTAEQSVAHLESSKGIYDAVMQDTNLPTSSKGPVISGLVAMDMMKVQESNLTDNLDELYGAQANVAPHVLAAKRIDNTIRALESAKTQLIRGNDKLNPAQLIVAKRHLEEVESQLTTAKDAQTKLQDSFTPEQLADTKTLPTFSNDPVILQRETERAITIAQHERFNKWVKEHYDPKQREARIAADKKEASDVQVANVFNESLNQAGVEMTKGKSTTNPDGTVITRPISIGEIQAHIDQAKLGLIPLVGTVHEPALRARVEAMEKYRDLHKDSAQGINRAAIAKAKADVVARDLSTRQATADEQMPARLAAVDAAYSQAQARATHPNRTQPVDDKMTNAAGRSITSPRLATRDGVDGIVDFQDGNPVFIADTGEVSLINPEEPIANQGVIIHRGAAGPKVVDIQVSGPFLNVMVGGMAHTIVHINPADALSFDADGNLESVTLVNYLGEQVIYKDANIIYDVADPIMLYQSLMDTFMENTLEVELDGRSYLVDYNHNDPMLSEVHLRKGTPVLQGKFTYRKADGSYSRKGEVINAVIAKFKADVLSKITAHVTDTVVNELNQPTNLQPNVSSSNPQLPGEITPAFSQGQAATPGVTIPQAAGATPATGTPSTPQALTLREEQDAELLKPGVKSVGQYNIPVRKTATGFEGYVEGFTMNAEGEWQVISPGSPLYDKSVTAFAPGATPTNNEVRQNSDGTYQIYSAAVEGFDDGGWGMKLTAQQYEQTQRQRNPTRTNTTTGGFSGFGLSGTDGNALPVTPSIQSTVAQTDPNFDWSPGMQQAIDADAQLKVIHNKIEQHEQGKKLLPEWVDLVNDLVGNTADAEVIEKIRDSASGTVTKRGASSPEGIFARLLLSAIKRQTDVETEHLTANGAVVTSEEGNTYYAMPNGQVFTREEDILYVAEDEFVDRYGIKPASNTAPGSNTASILAGLGGVAVSATDADVQGQVNEMISPNAVQDNLFSIGDFQMPAANVNSTGAYAKFSDVPGIVIPGVGTNGNTVEFKRASNNELYYNDKGGARLIPNGPAYEAALNAIKQASAPTANSLSPVVIAPIRTKSYDPMPGKGFTFYAPATENKTLTTKQQSPSSGDRYELKVVPTTDNVAEAVISSVLPVRTIVENGVKTIREFFDVDDINSQKDVQKFRTTSAAILDKQPDGSYVVREKGRVEIDYTDGSSSEDSSDLNLAAAEERAIAATETAKQAKLAEQPSVDVTTRTALALLGGVAVNANEVDADLRGISGEEYIPTDYQENVNNSANELDVVKPVVGPLSLIGNPEPDITFEGLNADGEDYLDNQVPDNEEMAESAIEKLAAEFEAREAAKDAERDNKLKAANPLRVGTTAFAGSMGGSGLKLTFQNGLPYQQNPEENIALDAMANPDFNVGSKVSFELGSNVWWDQKQKAIIGSDMWQLIPLFVLYDGKRVGKIQADHPMREDIVNALQQGRQVTASVNSKESMNLINLKDESGKPRMRPVSVMNGKWVGSTWTKSPVLLAVSIGMSPEGEFSPRTTYTGLDTAGLPQNVLDVLLTTEKYNQDGHVFAVIPTPNGNYMPYKLSTNFLSPQAVTKALNLLQAGEVGKLSDLVYTSTGADQLNTSRTFFRVLPTQNGQVVQFYSKAFGGVVGVDLADVQQSLLTGRQLRVKGLKQLIDGDVTKLVADGRDMLIDVKTELDSLLSNKKFHVDKSKLNSSRTFESPLTGTKYNSYLEYLSSTTEHPNGSILQTDSWGDGYPDGTAGGVFHFNVGMSFNEFKIGAAVIPQAAASTPQSATLNEATADELYAQLNAMDAAVAPQAKKLLDQIAALKDVGAVNSRGYPAYNLASIQDPLSKYTTGNPRDAAWSYIRGFGVVVNKDSPQVLKEFAELVKTHDNATYALRQAASAASKKEQTSKLAISIAGITHAVQDSVFGDESNASSESLTVTAPAERNTQLLPEDDDEQFSLGEDNDTLPRDMSAAQQWLSERAMPSSIYDYIKFIGNKVAHGSFSKHGVALWNKSEVGTEYHEGFHGVLRTFITQAERDGIISQARLRYGMSTETDLVVEERLADDFKHFVLTGIKPSDVRVRNLFQKLWDMLTAYFTNKLTVDKLFDSINRNTFDKTVKQGLSKEEVYSAKSRFSSETQTNVADSIASYVVNQVSGDANGHFNDVRVQFLQQAFVDPLTKTSFNPEVTQLIYKLFVEGKNMRDPANALPKEVQFSPKAVLMLNIVENWFDKTDTSEYKNLLEKGWQSLGNERIKQYGYRINGDMMLDEVEENLHEDKFYSKASVESSTKDTINAPVRRFLMQIPVVGADGNPVLNLLGNPTFVPFDTEVFPTLVRTLAGSADMKEIEARLREKSKELPWMSYVSQALQNGHGKTKVDVFRNQFYPAMMLIEKQFIYLNNEIVQTWDKANNRFVTDSTKSKQVNSNSSNINTGVSKKWNMTAHLPLSVGGSGLYVRQGDGEFVVDDTIRQRITRNTMLLQGVSSATDLNSPEGKAFIKNYEELLTDLGAWLPEGIVARYLKDGDRVKGDKTLLTGSTLLHRLVNDKIAQTMRRGVGVGELNSSLAKDKNIYEANSSLMKRLTQGVSKYMQSPTLSFLSGSNKSMYAANLPTPLDERIELYKGDSTFVEKMTYDAFYFPAIGEDGKVNPNDKTSSLFASTMLWEGRNAKFFKETIEKKTLDVLKETINGQVNNTEFDNLVEAKDLKTRLSAFLSSGKDVMTIAMHTLSDRGKLDFLTVPRFGYKNEHRTHYEHTVEEVLNGYVVQDIMSARRAKKDFDKAQRTGDTSELLANYHYNPSKGRDAVKNLPATATAEERRLALYSVPGRAMQFRQWDVLNTLLDPAHPGTNAAKKLMAIGLAQDTKDNFLSSLEEVKDLVNQTEVYIKSFLEAEQKALFTRLTELDLTPADFDLGFYNGDYQTALKDFVLGDTVARNEMAKMFSGDYAQYKNHENFSKRAGILESPGYKSAEQEGNASGYGDFKHFYTAFVVDQFSSNLAFDYVEKLSKYLTQKTLDQYRKGANETDAMGFTSLHKHRAKMQGRGDWTPNHEQAYANYYGKAFKKVRPQEGSTPGVFSMTSKKGTVTHPALTPIKTLTDSLMIHNGRVVRVVIKHSTFPLIEDITRMLPGLDSIREHMENSGKIDPVTGKKTPRIDVINMDSGAKAALWGNIPLTQGEDGRFTNLGDLTPIRIRTRDERSPQILPDTQANDPLWGSQLRKMIVTGLIQGGNYTYSDGKKQSGKELFDNYNQIGEALMNKSQQEMYEKLGYSPDVMTNPEKRKLFFMRFRDMLKASADGKDLSDNYIKALGLDTINGVADFSVPLALPPIQRKFETMVMGMFKKQVMQQRIHGSTAVQIANLGGHMFQDENDKLVNGELKFVTLGKDKNGEDIISHAEVAIPFELAVKMNLPRGFVTRDVDTGESRFVLDPKGTEYDLSGVDDELLTMVAYRIPTQGKNSMLPLKIVRVLPPSVKAIMVPGYITLQMGSDYDIDKLFLMKKNYEEVYTLPDGTRINKVAELREQLAKQEYILSSGEVKQLLHGVDALEKLTNNPTIGDPDLFKATWEKLTTALDEKLGDATPTIKKVLYDPKVSNNLDKEDYRERLENYLIDIAESILTSPLHANEMLTSVDSATLPDLAAELMKIDAVNKLKKQGIDNPSPQQIAQASQLSAQGILTEMTLAHRNKAGDAGIGIYATSGTGHAIGQYLKTDARVLRLSPEAAVIIDGEILSDLTITTGLAKFGSNDVSVNYNERLNAAVDNANSPIMGYLNDNSFTAPVTNLLIRVGLGNVLSTYVVRQPIIMELTEYYMNNELTPDRLNEAIELIGQRYDSSFSTKDAQMGNLTTAKLEKGLRATVQEDIYNQLNVLSNFLMYHKAGRMLSKVNKIANSDRISDMSTMSGIEEFQDIQDEVTNPNRNKLILNASLVVAGYQDNPYPLVRKYQDVINEAQTFAGQFFPYATPGMLAIKSSVREVLNKTSVSKPILDAINRDAALYIFTREGSPFKSLLTNVEQSVDELLTGKNSLVNRLTTIQNKHQKLFDMGKPSAYKLLSRLQPSESNLRPDNVYNTLSLGTSYTMSQFETNEIIDAFLSLTTSKDENDRSFAADLVRYTLLTTGFDASKDSLLELIPMEYWVDSRHYSGVTMAEFFRKNPPNFTHYEQMDFADKFIRNNTHLKGLVPKVNDIDTSKNEYLGKNTRKLFNPENQDSSPTGGWVKYITAYDKKNKEDAVYRFESVNPLTDMATYQKIPSIGKAYQLKNYSDSSLGSVSQVNKPIADGGNYDYNNRPAKPESVALFKQAFGVDELTPNLVGESIPTGVIRSFVTQYGNDTQQRLNTRLLSGLSGTAPEFYTSSMLDRKSRDGVGFYRYNDSRVSINLGLISTLPVASATQLAINTINHELLHHMSSLELVNNPTGKFGTRIKALYERAKLAAKNEEFRHYGLTNEREFVAEALTNPEFQFFLASYAAPVDPLENEYSPTTMWMDFIQSLRKLIGFTGNNSLLENTAKAVADLSSLQDGVDYHAYMASLPAKAGDAGVSSLSPQQEAALKQAENSGTYRPDKPGCN